MPPRTRKTADHPAAVTATLADLDSGEVVEPYVLGTPDGPVTFPDPSQWGIDDAEEFLLEFATPQSRPSQILAKWLTPADYTRLRKQDLSLRQLGTLLQQVNAHYGGVLGSPGESGASGT